MKTYGFSEAYRFLENALLGQPQKKLTDATKAFMSKEIEVISYPVTSPKELF